MGPGARSSPPTRSSSFKILFSAFSSPPLPPLSFRLPTRPLCPLPTIGPFRRSRSPTPSSSKPMLPSSAGYRVVGGPDDGGPRPPWATIRRPAFFVPVACALFLVITVLRSSSSTDSSFNIPATIHDLHDSVDKLVSAGTSLTSGRKGEPDEWSRNPFEEKGRLIVDLEVPIRNRWVPYDKTCKPSTYLNSLWRVENDDTPLIPVNDPSLAEELRLKSVGGNREFLPWLMNRTIVIHGDSIDRFHLKDFCSLVNGRLFVVSPDHPASPPPYHRSHVKQLGTNSKETKQSKAEQKARAEKERAWDARPMDGIELTNPWVCDIEEYGTTLVSVFTWGLEGAEEFFGSERWYYPPGECFFV